MEPDGGQTGYEPVIGWRVWALASNRLYSIAMNAFWRPGENQAECLVGLNHEIPAPSCHCGFWALLNPVSAIQLAARVEREQRVGSGFTVLDPHRTVAVGLILGYGATAVHGLEGYRAGLARVACIFADAPEALVREKADLRQTVADAYGVPCIALEAAISIGFLQELGVCGQAVEQLRAWIGTGRDLTDHERQIALMVAGGMTNREIARATSLTSRAVEVHLDKLMEKLRLRSRRDR